MDPCSAEVSQALQAWLANNHLSAREVDCVTSVMLKILDGKCKMDRHSKRVMRALYKEVMDWPGVYLKEGIHELIRWADGKEDDGLRDRIYEKRVLAETMISRPVMKAFKARIREQGLYELACFADTHNDGENDAE